MQGNQVEASPQGLSRIGGVLYLIIIVGGLIGEAFTKAVGVLMQIAGLCYLTNSFALLLAPNFASRIFPTILIPAFIGEASLCL